MKQKKGGEVQEHFVKSLKDNVAPGISLADDLADILGVSVDSAYRRLRGETDFTLSELYEISKKYGISLDGVFANQSDKVTFQYTPLTDSSQNFDKYLSDILHQLKRINHFKNAKMIYAADEIPIFHSFFSDELSAFKLFYWQRSVMNVPEYQGKKFTFDCVPKSQLILGKAINEEYLQCPSVEIWTVETILTNIKQVLYYYDSGAFFTKDDALLVLEHTRNMAGHLYQQAEKEIKLFKNGNEGGQFAMYSCDLVIGTNCIHVNLGDANFSYISFNTVNSLLTSHAKFCIEMDNWMKNLIRKSSLISGSAEKQRFQFFNTMNAHLDMSIQKLKDA